ncbi:MAG: hypothetical protein ACRDRX_21040 [Pseudonocardiaceae bacterium]
MVRPKPKLSTLAWWDDVTLGPDLGVAGASRDEVYRAMDWLLGRQDAIEAELAGRHLGEGGRAMVDLSSSWVEGSHCELAARGYSRDGKKRQGPDRVRAVHRPAGASGGDRRCCPATPPTRRRSSTRSTSSASASV